MKLQEKIEEAIEEEKEIKLLEDCFKYVTKRGKRTTKNFINYLNPIFDNYNKIKNKGFSEKRAKELAIYKELNSY